MYYLDWSHEINGRSNAKWRPVTTQVEKHVHLEFIGDSKTEYLVGNVKGVTGDYTHYAPPYPRPILAHVYHFEPNVPESKREQVTVEIRRKLADRHGITPEEITVYVS